MKMAALKQKAFTTLKNLITPYVVYDNTEASLDSINLKFSKSEGHLEKKFQEKYLNSNINHIRNCHFFTIFFYVLAGFVDYYLFPDDHLYIWAIRFLIVVPIFLLGYFFSYSDRYKKIWREISCFYILLTGGSFIVFTAIGQAPVAHDYWVGILFCMVFGYTFIREPFIYASIAGLTLIILYSFVALFLTKIPTVTLIISLFYLVLINFLGMLISKYLEVSARKDFFLEQILFEERNKIIELNNELERKVKERTYELDLSNQQLNTKIQDLNKSEEKFRAAFKTSPHVITLTRVEDGVYVDVNDAFTKLLGYSPEEIIGSSSLDFNIWNNSKDRDQLVSRLKESGLVENLQADFKGKEGQIINGLMSARILDIENKKYLLAVTQDMTPLKKIEQERLDLEIRLQQAQKMEAIGTLAGGIAHDFNNILSGIFGYSQLALKEIEDTKKVKDRINKIDKGAKRAAELVRQILTFSRQDVYQKHPLKISFAIKEALQLLRSTIPTSIEIKKRILSKSTVLADPIKIHQLLINLCTNAYHAIGEKSGSITISLTDKNIRETEKSNNTHIPPGEYLILEVTDTGTGIDPSIIDKIFDPYFTTKEVGRGTGLGLALVKAIVKEHEGFLKVSSLPGEGTSFFVYFPILQQNSEQRVSSATEEPKDFHDSGRIMIVDDEKAIRDVSEEILTSHGYDVTVFENGSQALSEFGKDPNKYDLIITDMTMPKLTGDKLAIKILDINPDMPVLICTGYSETLSDEKASAIGIKKVLNKPLEMNTLLKNIRKILNERAVKITKE